MIRVAIILGLAGLAGATALFVVTGIQPVLDAFIAAGPGVVWAALFHFLPMTVNGRAWQVLLPERSRRELGFFVWVVWLRQAINNLMPVARIGGEVAAIQILMRGGMRGPRAVASLLLEMTLSIGSQFLFTMVGLGILLLRGAADESLVRVLAFGLGAAAILGAGFLIAQRRGIFRLLERLARRLFGERVASFAGGAAALDRAVRALYRRRSGLAKCFFWQLLGWFGGAAEIAIVLHFLGQSAVLADAVIIEAVIEAVGSAAFVVPGALGVQEGGFLAVGGLLGLSPDIALALALARRARDVLVLLPALLAWQISFGRWILARS